MRKKILFLINGKIKIKIKLENLEQGIFTRIVERAEVL